MKCCPARTSWKNLGCSPTGGCWTRIPGASTVNHSRRSTIWSSWHHSCCSWWTVKLKLEKSNHAALCASADLSTNWNWYSSCSRSSPSSDFRLVKNCLYVYVQTGTGYIPFWCDHVVRMWTAFPVIGVGCSFSYFSPSRREPSAMALTVIVWRHLMYAVFLFQLILGVKHNAVRLLAPAQCQWLDKMEFCAERETRRNSANYQSVG